MLTKNNWFNTSLQERFYDKNSPFRFKINPYNFKSLAFNDAADLTARSICEEYSNLYLAFSGGMDSEFVLRCFNRNNITIKPVIVKCGNPIEIQYAFKICDELKIEPIILEVDEDYLYQFWYINIFKKFNGIGVNSSHNLIASSYVSQFSDAIMISGNHLMSDEQIITEKDFFIGYEWDFYTDYFLSKCNNINFYCYSLELIYAAAPLKLNFKKSWIDYKAKLFNVPYRKKNRHRYSDAFYNKINKTLSHYGYVQKIEIISDIWTKKQFCDTFYHFIK